MKKNNLHRILILDELFDLSLYRALAKIAPPDTKKVFEQLIPIEEGHLAFWQDFFHQNIERLDFWRACKLKFFVLLCRIFGPTAMHLILEAIEVYGVRKYLSIWEEYRNEPLGAAVKEVLQDELKHEDMVVSQIAAKKINPERIRNVFLGLNDGLVEITGAVSGFFAAFQSPIAVVVAGFTVAIAGSFSMAAGVYIAANSEKEVDAIEAGKRKFLSEAPEVKNPGSALSQALIVGVSYFLGAGVPIIPVLFGATNPIYSFVCAGILIVLVSFTLAFLSGMNIRRRIVMNVVIVSLAVIVTYAVGLLIKIS